MRRWERRLRLGSGLTLAVFVTAHLLNHSAGLLSLDAMEALRHAFSAVWRSVPGSLLLYTALVGHFLLGLWSLYRRSTLRMPWWEAAQITLGLCILPLLAGHIAATRGGWMLYGRDIDYSTVVGGLWSDPWLVAKQLLIVAVVWGHLCVGLHHWLRLRRGYRRALPLLYPAAVVLPLLAVLGFARIGVETTQASVQGTAPTAAVDSSWTLGDQLAAIALALVAATLAARQLRLARNRRRRYRLLHSGGRELRAARGHSVLEALRAAGIPHASVCGGRARCTTCRVRIGAGLAELPPAGALERAALQRIDAPPNVRLACQTRPAADVQITPLVAAGVGIGGLQAGVSGRECLVTALFVDLRGSTRLGEQRLPYDVLFILNRFFAAMQAALDRSDGHYAQFNGDGLLALYGLRGDAGAGCRAALAGARAMVAEVGALNLALASELNEPLRIGIGIHHGEAIVGSMGPPRSPILTAIGDTINTAARLEASSKDYDCTLMVSTEAVDAAGTALPDAVVHQVRVRGKAGTVAAYALGVESLGALAGTGPP